MCARNSRARARGRGKNSGIGLLDDAAVVHEDHGARLRKAHFVGDDQHGHVLVGQLSWCAAPRQSARDPARRGRLVEQHDVRFRPAPARWPRCSVRRTAGDSCRLFSRPTLRSSSSALGTMASRGMRLTVSGASMTFCSTVMREQVERLEHHAHLAADAAHVRTTRLPPAARARNSPSTAMLPSSMVSRWFRQRRKVLLPEPDGPITATTSPLDRVSDAVQHAVGAEGLDDAVGLDHDGTIHGITGRTWHSAFQMLEEPRTTSVMIR